EAEAHVARGAPGAALERVAGLAEAVREVATDERRTDARAELQLERDGPGHEVRESRPLRRARGLAHGVPDGNAQRHPHRAFEVSGQLLGGGRRRAETPHEPGDAGEAAFIRMGRPPPVSGARAGPVALLKLADAPL